jgi:enoyl-CoA hydratase/carnithine racemase
MGGGLGLFAGASHRIVTRLSLLSMPEITIGLFPDVGATWFLNRMPGRCGLFAAMTAARMNAADALYLGLADYYLPEMNRDTLVSWLATLPLSGNHEQNHTQLDEALTASATPLPEMDMPSHFHQHMGLISHVCDSQDPLIINRMIEALDPPDEWMNQCRSHHLDGSPLSVCVMASQLREGRFLDLEAVFRKELDMAVNMSRHQEFAIGVKALLIDKNRSPQWTWKQVDEVPESSVADLLSSPWTEEQHPFYQLNPNPGRGLEIK